MVTICLLLVGVYFISTKRTNPTVAKKYLKEGLNASQNENYTGVAHLFKKACDMGNIEGCLRLGYLYENGKGVTKNYTKAAQLYDKSCDMGNAEGCNNLDILCNQKPWICK